MHKCRNSEGLNTGALKPCIPLVVIWIPKTFYKMERRFLLLLMVTTLSLILWSPSTQAQLSEDCGGLLEGGSGIIQTPNYPLNYPLDKSCSWIIKVQPREKVVLSFETFVLEDDSTCKYDYVLIRDGSSSKSPMIGKFCGTSRPATITSTANYLWVDFRSDSTATRRGFKAVWRAEKFESPTAPTTKILITTKTVPPPTPPKGCGAQMSGEGGTFSTPEYPKPYPLNKECIWSVATFPGDTVELTFHEFHVENSGSCRFDFVQVRDGSDIHSPLIGQFCASMIIQPIKSTSNSLFIRFVSDGSVKEKGFNATWKRIAKPTSSPPPTTKQARECGGTFRGDNGEISSPGYPSQYPLSKECTWIISVPSGQSIELQFNKFELEQHLNCGYDFLEVRDGDSSQKPLLGKFCGGIVPTPLKTSGDTVYIKFYSDGFTPKAGFVLRWRAIDRPSPQPGPEVKPDTPGGSIKECGGTYTQMSGAIQSPRYPTNYPTDVICQWFIEVPAEYVVRLEFIDFQLEASLNCQYDYVRVMDGPPGRRSELGKYCGNLDKGLFVDSKSNKMFVTFRSERSNTKKGFEAYWYAQRRATPSFTTSTSDTGHLARCGGNHTDPSSDIFSPYYPKPSFNPVTCVWVMSVYDNDKIAFGFNEFDLANHPKCATEYVELRDGGSEKSPLLGRYCGSVAPMIIIGSSDKMWLLYHSDGTGKKGFEATWTTMSQAIKPMGSHGSANKIDKENPKPPPSPPKRCGEALGFESGAIKDSQLKASSVWMGLETFGPQRARLNNQKWPQGWSTDPGDNYPWLKISLQSDYVVTGVATQGYGNSVFDEWVQSYYLMWLDAKAGEVYYHEDGKLMVLDGNSDRDTVVRHVFKQPFVTSQVTIRPRTWKGSVGLRMELYGCNLADCQEPLGVQDGRISDSQLTSSSAWNNAPQKFGAHRARLNLVSWPQGWTANAEDSAPWLQVDLKSPFIITRVATQGYGGTLEQWVKKYRLSWRDEEGHWRNYTMPQRMSSASVPWEIKIFHGNNDRTTEVSRQLHNTIKSSVVRFWPLSEHNFVSMRTELYGCLAEPSTIQTKCSTTGQVMSGESSPPSKRECEWHIVSSKDNGKVILTFTTFDMSDSSCAKDYVEVRNGLTRYAPIIGKFCGPNPPSLIQSSGSGLLVRYIVSGEVATKVRMIYQEGPDRTYQNDEQNKGCGARKLKATPRQDDGRVPDQWPGQWPWQVALLLMGQSIQQCGGALIAPQWILTAAHCFKRFKQPYQWIVRAGEWDLTMYEGSEQNMRAKAIYIHSLYIPKTNENDIALVYLERPVEINDKVNVICLPNEGDVRPGSVCAVAGWGSTSYLHHSSSPMRSHEIPIVSRQACNQPHSYGGLVREGMICAGFERGGDDSCYGDGGGPLMCKNAEGRWVLGGVNSWGQSCGLPGKYGVFTLTERYKDWINRHMQAD